MSQRSSDHVQAGLERFIATGEPPHERVEVHDHDILDVGEYRGHAGFGRRLEDPSAAREASSMEAEECREADRRVEEKSVRPDYCNDRARAAAIVGLAE
jgi:hypothetical protein